MGEGDEGGNGWMISTGGGCVRVGPKQLGWADLGCLDEERKQGVRGRGEGRTLVGREEPRQGRFQSTMDEWCWLRGG